MTVHKVCGGHGAVRDSFGDQFTIPKGITLCFYVPHGHSLPNDIGQKIDQFVNDGPDGGPAPVGIPLKHPDKCHPYRLYNHRGGGYLNLKMTSKANPNYITTNQSGGKPLKEILENIALTTEDATVHWSACRAIETDADPEDFPDDQPKKIDFSKVRVNENTEFKQNLNTLLTGGGSTSLAHLPSDVPATAPTAVHKKHGFFSKLKQVFSKNK